jgi:hypothetical protein
LCEFAYLTVIYDRRRRRLVASVVDNNKGVNKLPVKDKKRALFLQSAFGRSQQRVRRRAAAVETLAEAAAAAVAAVNSTFTVKFKALKSLFGGN